MFFYSYSHFFTIDSYAEHFDSEINLLRANKYDTKHILQLLGAYNIPYKDNMVLHTIEESAEYALKLFMSPTSENLQRAKNIISTILSLQELHPQSSYYGAFPTYYEYPISSPNTPQYEGTTATVILYFLQMLINFKGYLSKSIQKRIKASCFSAIFFISTSEKTLVYSASIHSLFHSAVLLVFGSFFKQSEYLHLGINKFNEYYFASKFNDAFWEHNAPCETYFISSLLEFISSNIKAHNMLSKIDELNDMLWKSISFNFHASLNKLTGPNSNATKIIPDETFLRFVNKSIKNIQITPNNVIVNDTLKCPPKYRIFFDNVFSHHFQRTQISQGSTLHNFVISHIASNYLQNEYAVGSFNKEEFWTNHTPFCGYIKSQNAQTPYQFKLKVLNNDHDFASAELHSIQEKGFIFGHIFFNTNRGNYHISHDNTNGKIITSDFRIRFEITGDINNLDIKTRNKCLTISHGSTTITYNIPYFKFDDINIKHSITQTETHLYFDAYLDISQNYEINLSELEEAIFQFSFLISSTNKKIEEVKNSLKNGFIVSEAEHNSHHLCLKTPYKPNNYEFMNTQSKEYIDDITLTHYTALSQQKNKHFEFITNHSDVTDISINFENHFTSLDSLIDAPIHKLCSVTKKILNDLLKNNYNINIFNRCAVSIIYTVFERMENDNIQCRKIINTNYPNIYQKISTSPSAEYTVKIINKTVDSLYKEFEILRKSYKQSSTIQEVISIIDKNYQNPELSISMIAEKIEKNASFISREFKNKTSTNYVKYLTSVRMTKAKELLLTDTPLKDIAIACGYLHLTNFRRVFKQHTGMTISDWLEQQK